MEWRKVGRGESQAEKVILQFLGLVRSYLIGVQTSSGLSPPWGGVCVGPEHSWLSWTTAVVSDWIHLWRSVPAWPWPFPKPVQSHQAKGWGERQEARWQGLKQGWMLQLMVQGPWLDFYPILTKTDCLWLAGGSGWLWGISNEIWSHSPPGH